MELLGCYNLVVNPFLSSMLCRDSSLIRECTHPKTLFLILRTKGIYKETVISINVPKTFSHLGSYRVFIGVCSCLLFSLPVPLYELSPKTCGSSHYHFDVLEFGMLSCIMLLTRLFDYWLTTIFSYEFLTALLSIVMLVHLFLPVNSWMILRVCLLLRSWHMAGGHKLIRDNSLVKSS